MTNKLRQPIQRAFTLVELLVVIGIIAVLASLILTSLARAKDSATKIACNSNLRQIGIGLLTFTHDNEHYPAYLYWNTSISPLATYGWPAQLLPGVSSNTTVFRCPATDRRFEWTKEKSGKGYPFPHNIDSTDTFFSYGYNQWGVANSGGLALGVAPGSEVPVSRVVNPSDMIALGDSDGSGVGDGSISFHRAAMPTGPQPIWPPGKRHKSGANIVFCDGHVEWQRQSKWIESKPEAARRWNNDNQPHATQWTSSLLPP